MEAERFGHTSASPFSRVWTRSWANSQDSRCCFILWSTFSLSFGEVWDVGGGSTALLLVLKLSRTWNIISLVYKNLRRVLDFPVARRETWKVVKWRKRGEKVWWRKILFSLLERNSQFCSWLVIWFISAVKVWEDDSWNLKESFLYLARKELREISMYYLEFGHLW